MWFRVNVHSGQPDPVPVPEMYLMAVRSGEPARTGIVSRSEPLEPGNERRKRSHFVVVFNVCHGIIWAQCLAIVYDLDEARF